MKPSLRARAHHVLCAVDFSDASRRALRYGASFAAHVGAEFTVLFVNDPLLSTAAASVGYNQRKLDTQTRKELRRFVEAVVADIAPGPTVRYAIALGDPAREIHKHARQLRATLIVMGTHGLRGPKKLFLGSTTERTLRDSRVPVLAIPHRGPRQPPPGWPRAPVLAAIEFGAKARDDVRAAADVARLFEADLLLVHVLRDPMVPSWLKRPARGAESERLAHARAALAQLATAAGSDVSVSFRVARGEPADALARAARARKAGTLVIVLRHGEGWFGTARGTVTYQVLTSAVTPVLALPGQPATAVPVSLVWK